MRAPTTPTPVAPAPHRGSRASILAVVVVQLSVLGHLTGGGMLPDGPAVALALALSWPVCWQLSAVRRSFPTILAALALAQPVLHVILEFGGALLAGTAGHTASHHAAVAASGASVTSTSAGSGAVAMISFHAVAAVLSAVVLARGEQALCGVVAAGRRVAGWVVSSLAARAGAPMPSVRPAATPDVRLLPPRRAVSLPARHGRRGPPVALGAH